MTKRSAGVRYLGVALGLTGLIPLVEIAHAADLGAGPPQSNANDLSEVVIIGTTPMPGSGVDLDKIPSNVQTIGAAGLDPDGHSDPLPIAAARRLGSVNLNDEQGNPYQPDFVYRGFEASPISGVAEGLAVYQNGTRLNEALGDNVNWDLVPQFAVNRLTVQSDNPVFGLNALGGAVTLDMKNAFNSPGGDVEVSHGNFGNTTGYASYGFRDGNIGAYAAVGGVRDSGFRFLSPTDLRQGYGDIGYEDDTATLHASVTAANNYIGAVGPTPVEMLAADPRSIFTYPQSMHNEMQLMQLTGTLKATDTVLLSASAYYRHFEQHLTDGNTTDVTACTNDGDFFCLEGNDLYPDDVLYDNTGNQVPTSVLPAGATPGETDFTTTNTNTVGGAFQVTFTMPLAGMDNNLAVGASVDHSVTHYAAYGELGTVEPNLDVVGAGVIIDQGLSPTASPPIEEPVSVRPTTDYYGLFFTDTLSVTKDLAWTLSGRWNRAQIAVSDLLGEGLDSSHSFERFNPGTGITYKLTDGLTVYAGYSEANRAPTAGELNCADPTSPCILDAFLVSDPDLKQVISRTYEVGLRGHFTAPDKSAQVQWYASAFRTDNSNDITLLATQINGFGYFANTGTTRRQGLEAGFTFTAGQWEGNFSYTLLDATFRENLTLSSNSPDADDNGNIQVTPGDRIPLTPRSRLTLGVDYSPIKQWKIGGDLRYTSSQFLLGDESNQEAPLPGFTVVNFHSSYAFSNTLQLFAGVDNAFDKTYYTFATFTELDGLPPNFNLTNPRTYSPSPPRTYFAGVRLSF
jgi:iron complex outermembrane receptor protein